MIKSNPPATVDEFLSKLPVAKRDALQSLRELLLSLIPNAEEVISYQIPIVKYRGRGLLGFSARENHCSLHLMSPPLAKAMEKDLKKYLRGVTLHFTPEKPLPVSLVKKIVKARLKEVA